MMKRQASPFPVLIALAALPLAVMAQDVPIVGYHVPSWAGWSPVTNGTQAPIVSAPIVITQPSSPWLKLWFGGVDLGTGSVIRVTGSADEEVQVLDAAALAAWSDTSAYFNGDTVVVELVIPPGDTASAHVAGFDAGFAAPFGPDTICGPTDDRVPSTERRVGRMLNSSMNALCSGGLVSTNSCYLTAGHCVTGGSIFTVEFNCPQSTPSGAIVHPPVTDQYPLNYATLGSQSGGIGNDWAIARLSNNTTTGLPASLIQGYYNLAASLPAVSQTTRITGFGTASGVLNLSNKTHAGPLVTSGGGNGTTLQYQVDTTSGNSGSSVVHDPTQLVFGVHTHSGCTSSGGANSGTAITQAGLQAHYAATCTAGPPSYAIAATQTGAGAPINITVTGAPASSEIYNLFSGTPAVPTGSGEFFGLDVDLADLLVLIGLPLGAEPIHVLASPAGAYAFVLPTGLPGVSVSLDLVSVAFAAGTSLGTFLGVSPAVNATLSF